MEWPSKCPICGGEIVEKTVEKIVKGGDNTAALKVTAGVCLKCGEHIYDPQTVEKFERLRVKLSTNKVEGLKLVGKSYAAG